MPTIFQLEHRPDETLKKLGYFQTKKGDWRRVIGIEKCWHIKTLTYSKPYYLSIHFDTKIHKKGSDNQNLYEVKRILKEDIDPISSLFTKKELKNLAKIASMNGEKHKKGDNINYTKVETEKTHNIHITSHKNSYSQVINRLKIAITKVICYIFNKGDSRKP